MVSCVFVIFIENMVIGRFCFIVMCLLMFSENVVLFIDGWLVMMIRLLFCILFVMWLRLMKLVGMFVMLFWLLWWYSLLMCLIICVSSGWIFRKFFCLCEFFLVIVNILDLVLFSSWCILWFCGLKVLVEILLVIVMSWCSMLWLCMIFV